MSNPDLNVSTALLTRLDSLPDKPQVAWENDGYKPVAGTLYIEPSQLPSQTFNSGVDYLQQLTGVFRVLIFDVLGKGRATADTTAQNIMNHFAAAPRLFAEGQLVETRAPSRNAGIRVGDRWVVAVEIPYSSYARR